MKSRLISKFSTKTLGPLTNIEARWPKLPLPEQGAIADIVNGLEKGDWRKMSLEEKRAGKL